MASNGGALGLQTAAAKPAYRRRRADARCRRTKILLNGRSPPEIIGSRSPMPMAWSALRWASARDGVSEVTPPPAPLALTASVTAALHAGTRKPGSTSPSITPPWSAFLSVTIIFVKLFTSLCKRAKTRLPFTPERDWGSRIGVRIETSDFKRLLPASLTLPLLPEGQEAPRNQTAEDRTIT